MTTDKKSLLNQFTEGVNKGIKQTSEAAQMVGETVLESAQAVGNTVVDGVNSAGTTVERGAQAISESAKLLGETVVDGVQRIGKVISDGGNILLEDINEAGAFVADQVNGSIGVVRDGVYYVGGKAVEGTVVVKDGVLSVGETIVGSVINTSRFVTDKEYRDSEGIPWLKEVIETNREIIAYQIQQNQRAMELLYYASLGKELNEDELEIVSKQITDMTKLVPVLAIFLLPGGTVLLPILAKLLPWDMIPDLKPPKDVNLAPPEATPTPEAAAESHPNATVKDE